MLKVQSLKALGKWALVCATLVAGYEGLWLIAKPDTLAYGIPTVCYGETENVKVGDTYTKPECLTMLAEKLPRYYAEIARCIKVSTSDNEKIAYTSFAYNVGSAGFCRSTTLRLLNAGDHKGACDALMAWTRAGGKFVQGLHNRRAKERIICLTPDKAVMASQEAPVPDKAEPSPTPAAKLGPLPLPPKVCKRWWFFWKVCK